MPILRFLRGAECGGGENVAVEEVKDESRFLFVTVVVWLLASRRSWMV